MKFTLIEVVVALGILALSMAGLLQLLTASQERVGRAAEEWQHTHMLMQAAEYVLLQEGQDDEPAGLFPLLVSVNSHVTGPSASITSPKLWTNLSISSPLASFS